MEASQQQASRRRTRQEVQQAVRAALAELLAEGPFKDVTVEELARRGGLSRTAFYFYYPDKNEVLKEAANAAAAEVYAEADRWWHGEGRPEQLVREALEGIAAVFEQHADMLRAAVEATTYDPEFRVFYESLIRRFVTATAEHLRRELVAGRLRPLDADPVAEALVWMAERCNYAFLVMEGRPAGEVVDPLTAIWVHALYPDERRAPDAGPGAGR
jgi:TetR/AcrR family transcriptional regulator, ethionamide resistance regulator